MKLSKIILKYENAKALRFVPKRDFYISIGIRQKRWGQLIRNEVDPTAKELKAISEYFDCSVMELYDFNK